MTIQTLDQALAGMQCLRMFRKNTTGTMVAQRPISTWRMAGIPVGGSDPSAAPGVSRDINSIGALVFDTSDTLTTYLAHLQASATIAGTLVLCDRLWDVSVSPTSASAQTINSSEWPARDHINTSNGEGVMLGVEVQTNTSTNAPVLTVAYTNSAGTQSRSGVNTVATAATSVANTFYPIGLQGNDRGVRSVQTYTQSVTWTAGALALVAYHPIATIDITAANQSSTIDVLTGGLPVIHREACLFFLFWPSTTTTSNISGHYRTTIG